MSLDHVYVAIPRTASNSIHKVLGQIKGENHLSINNIDREGYSFAFVRNPFDLLVSWFYFHKLYQKQEIYDTYFLNWVFEGCPTHWGDQFIKDRGLTHPLNQHEYVCKDGEIVVDYIGKFETLQEDFDTICNNINFKQTPLPYINNVRHNNWQTYYTPKGKAFVKELFSKDFELFNY